MMLPEKRISTVRRALIDGLYYLPYWKGKGTVTLSLLRKFSPAAPVAAKMPYGGRIWIGSDPMRQALLPYWIGQYEPHVISIFRQQLTRMPSGSSVIDVGANLGFYTVLAAAYLRQVSRGKVFAYEPDPTAFRELASNIELNGFTNVVLSSDAVFSKTGTAEFFSHPEGITLGSLNAFDRATVSSVSLTTLDELREQSGPIGLVKIDVEGAELMALQGARFLLEQDRPAVLFEEFDKAYHEFGYSMRDVRNYFEMIEYRLFWIRAKFGGATLLDLDTEIGESGPNYRNILALPKEPS